MPTVSSSEPSLATGARSTTGPDEIVLAFSEPIDGRPHISLRTATGTQINLAFGSTDPGDTCVHANIPTLAATSTLPPVETLARDGQTTEANLPSLPGPTCQSRSAPGHTPRGGSGGPMCSSSSNLLPRWQSCSGASPANASRHCQQVGEGKLLAEFVWLGGAEGAKDVSILLSMPSFTFVCSSWAGCADHIEVGERRDFHDVSGLWGVNDHASSDVHTHVTEVDLEEDEIPGLKRA